MLWNWIVVGLICTFRWNRRRRCNSSPCSWVWSSCSRPCGRGWQSPRITRQKGACGRCNLPSSRWCNTQCCPVNCRWTSWSSYSLCSKSCGIGTRFRTRHIAVAPSCNGAACYGGDTEVAFCQFNPICPSDHRRNKSPSNKQIEIISDIKSAKPQPKTTEDNNQLADFKNSGNIIDKRNVV